MKIIVCEKLYHFCGITTINSLLSTKSLSMTDSCLIEKGFPLDKKMLLQNRIDSLSDINAYNNWSEDTIRFFFFKSKPSEHNATTLNTHLYHSMHRNVSNTNLLVTSAR